MDWDDLGLFSMEWNELGIDCDELGLIGDGSVWTGRNPIELIRVTRIDQH